MKKFFAGLIGVLMILFVAANISATTIWYELSNFEYKAPAKGFNNDNSQSLGDGSGQYVGSGRVQIINSFGDNKILDFFVSQGYSDIKEISISTFGNSKFAGYWTTTDPIKFLFVSGGSHFSIHEYNESLGGIWDTGYLRAGNSGDTPGRAGNSGNIPGKSTIRAYGKEPVPVSEPSAIILYENKTFFR